MKHKDHESQRLLGSQNYTNYLTKCLKLTSIKRFGKDVSILTFSRDIFKSHNLPFHQIPNKVISNLYVFSHRVLDRILWDINSIRIITINNHGVLWYPIITQKLFYPKKLWTTTSSSNILYFCIRQRDRIFLFTHPSNKIGSHIKTPTSGAFSIIGISDPIWIRKSSRRQIWLFTIEQSIITSSINIFYDSFNNIQMWNFRIKLKSRAYTNTENNIKMTCSLIQKTTNHASI